jgi:hypothetical protein
VAATRRRVLESPWYRVEDPLLRCASVFVGFANRCRILVCCVVVEAPQLADEQKEHSAQGGIEGRAKREFEGGARVARLLSFENTKLHCPVALPVQSDRDRKVAKHWHAVFYYGTYRMYRLGAFITNLAQQTLMKPVKADLPARPVHMQYLQQDVVRIW